MLISDGGGALSDMLDGGVGVDLCIDFWLIYLFVHFVVVGDVGFGSFWDWWWRCRCCICDGGRAYVATMVVEYMMLDF